MSSHDLENQDLQSYLDSFNKEIEDGDASLVTLSEEQMCVLTSGSSKLTAPNQAATTTSETSYYIKDTKADAQVFYKKPQSLLQSKSTKSKAPTSMSMTTPKRMLKRQDFNVSIASTSSNSKASNTEAESFVVILNENGAPNRTTDTDFLNISNIKELYDFDTDTELEDNDDDVDADDADLQANVVDDAMDPLAFLGKKNANIRKHTTATATTADNEIYRCSICPYETPKRRLLTRHSKIHSDYRPFKCSVCERGFKKHSGLLNHVNTHLGKKPHQCKSCTSAFTTSGELVRHVRYRHTGEKPHKCPECNYASVELSKLRRHIRCHTGERPYQCPHCTYASPDTFKLKRHMRTHTGEKPYECDICNARFSQSNSLKAHKLIHSVGDKPVFQCELCPTTCGRKTDLRLHMHKLHNPEHPVTCRRCNKECPDRYSYKIHTKTHKGEKCYRCTICAYASVSQRHLESHMLVHTNVKPFTCSDCPATFRQMQLLKRHANLYHNATYVPPTPREKAHACPDCHRTFTHKGNLMRHMEIHDPEYNNLKMEFKNSADNLSAENLAEQEFDTISFSADDVFEVNGEQIIVKGKRHHKTEHNKQDSFYETYEVFETLNSNNNDAEEQKPFIHNIVFSSDTELVQTAPTTFSIKKEHFVEKPQVSEIDAADDGQYMVLEVIQCDDDEDDINSTIAIDLPEVNETPEINLPLPKCLELGNDDEKFSDEFLSAENDAPATAANYKTLENCFGFNEDDEVENQDEFKTESEVIDLIVTEQHDDDELYSITSDNKEEISFMDIMDDD